MLGVFIFFILATRFLVVDVGQVDGQSMEPTFIDNQLFVVNRLGYLYRRPARHDIVQVVVPGSDKVMLKRVVGLPGETIIIKRGKVFVQAPDMGQERQIIEPYLPTVVYTKIVNQAGPRKFRLFPGQYFVLGDNREHSTDSRDFGPVSREYIVGQAMWWRQGS